MTMPKNSTKWENVVVWEALIQDMAIAQMRCPMCKRYATHLFHLGYNNPLEGMNYCPYCGERMKE